jgi:hypothetical protein
MIYWKKVPINYRKYLNIKLCLEQFQNNIPIILVTEDYYHYYYNLEVYLNDLEEGVE